MPAKKEVNITKKESPLNGAKKLDRSKLHSISDISGPSEEEGSLRAIIILIVVIIVVAVGGAYFIKNLQKNVEDVNPEDETEVVVEENQDEEPTEEVVEEELSLVDQILKTEVKKDSEASNLPTEEMYSEDDKEMLNESETTYTLESILAQPFESFYRVSFKFQAGDAAEQILLPGVNVNLRSIVPELLLTFMNTSEDNSGLLNGQAISIDDSVLASLVKSIEEEGSKVVYQLKLDEATSYSIQQDKDTLIIDIKELIPRVVEEESEEVVDEEDSTNEEESLEEPTDEEVNEGDEVVNDEPKTNVQTSSDIQSDETGKVAGIKGFTFDDEVEKFVYRLTLSNTKIPNVTSNMSQDGVLTVKINNLSFDAIAKEPEYANISFPEAVADVNSVSASYADGISTYVFKADKKVDYNIELGTYKNEKVILIEFLH